LAKTQKIIGGTKMYKIGLSFSGCVHDILVGKVDINDVAVVLTGTNIVTPKDWHETMELYGKTSWTEDPIAGQKIAMELRNSGRLVQPRNTISKVHNISQGHWIELSEAIELHHFDIYAFDKNGRAHLVPINEWRNPV
jgi:hypothetical protein